MKNEKDTPIARAIKMFGNQQNLADKVGFHQTAVSGWKNGTRKIPGEAAKKIQEISGGEILAHEMRPDIFDPPEAARA